MIPNTDFYSAYLNNHFKIKSRISAYLLNLDQTQINILTNQVGINVNDIEFLKTVKIDLIQAFYQSVESLFGLMHSLENAESNTSVPDYLVNAKIGDLHKYVASFLNFDYCYNYLISDVDNIQNKSIPKYQWLFYFATLFVKDVPTEYLDRVGNADNIKGIAYTLNTIAKQFNKEAHNSIKHGLRCILIDKFNIQLELPDELNLPNLPDELMKFSGENDVLMYYTKGPKGDNSATTVLVPIDVKYIIYLEDGINKLLFNLIEHRHIIFGKDKPEEVKAHFFSYNELISIKFPDKANFESIRMGSPL